MNEDWAHTHALFSLIRTPPPLLMMSPLEEGIKDEAAEAAEEETPRRSQSFGQPFLWARVTLMDDSRVGEKVYQSAMLECQEGNGGKNWKIIEIEHTNTLCER